MTNELGTTLQDIEAKAELKREAMTIVKNRMDDALFNNKFHVDITEEELETIRKYIEEN